MSDQITSQIYKLISSHQQPHLAWPTQLRTPSSSFIFFTQLPVELRLEIWRLSFSGPRMLSVDWFIKAGGVQHIPQLRTCQESRKLALARYEPAGHFRIPMWIRNGSRYTGGNIHGHEPVFLEHDGERDILRAVLDRKAREINRLESFFSYRFWNPREDIMLVTDFYDDPKLHPKLAMMKKATTISLPCQCFLGVGRSFRPHAVNRELLESFVELKTLLLIVNLDQPPKTGLLNSALRYGKESCRLVDVNLDDCPEADQDIKRMIAYFGAHPIKSVETRFVELKDA